MWKTAIILILSIILIPTLGIVYDEPLSEREWRLLYPVLVTYGVATLIVFILSSITKNYSQVDKLWSIIPIVYAWEMAYFSSFDARGVLMACLVTLWGARLTYNFSRRGGYSWRFWEGEEDYRWSILQARKEFKAPWKWVAFNLMFISIYQMGLIMLFTLPMLKSTVGSPLNLFDYLLAILFVFWVVWETIADQQQWVYQKEKYRRIHANEELEAIYEVGFVHKGLWGLVRHPNYLAEQAIWITFYFFSVTATGDWLNWTISGCVLLCALFFGSSEFSEGVSATKYPLYAKYQEQVGRFLPRLSGKFDPVEK